MKNAAELVPSIIILAVLVLILWFRQLDQGTLISLVVSATLFFAEKHYIEKLNVLPNIGMLAVIILPMWTISHDVLKWYLGIGLSLGVAGTLMHYGHIATDVIFRVIAYTGYSLKVVLPVYITYLLVGLTTWVSAVLGVCLILYFWYVAYRFLGHDLPWEID